MTQDESLHGIRRFGEGGQIFGAVVASNDGRRLETSAWTARVDPRMCEDHVGAVALGGILHEQMIDEIFRFLTYKPPLAPWEIVDPLLDAVKELILTGLTKLTTLPATVRAAASIEWRVPA